MAYPFVAAPDNWPRNGVPIMAIAIHMAEGGGTVTWLTHNDGNSSHYVVEYSGRVVQMVQESRAAGSINPQLLRTTNDTTFTYLGEFITFGVTAAKKALGVYWSNPNSAVIAIEIEGFAANGPNDAQRKSLAALVKDIRTRLGKPTLPCLGHRDFQNYKACPGHKIPWADYGGHGVQVLAPKPVEDPMGLGLNLDGTKDLTPLDAFGTTSISGDNHRIIRVKDKATTPVANGLPLGVVQKGRLTSPLDSGSGDRTSVVVFNNTGDNGELYVALLADTTGVKPLAAPADTTPYSATDLQAATAAAAAKLTQAKGLADQIKAL